MRLDRREGYTSVTVFGGASGMISGRPMDKRSILAVEDDPAIRRGVADALQFAGFHVQQAGNACEGDRLARAGRFDLILLDVVLPDGSGLDLLSEIRERSPQQAVILLTARGEEHDRVNGLRRGADDYIVKPFSVKELLARVDAVLRRAGPSPVPQGRIDLGDHGCVDLATCELTHRNGERRELSPREVQLVDYLTRHCDRVVTRGIAAECLGSGRARRDHTHN